MRNDDRRRWNPRGRAFGALETESPWKPNQLISRRSLRRAARHPTPRALVTELTCRMGGEVLRITGTTVAIELIPSVVPSHLPMVYRSVQIAA
jgi:hypothetical protein